MDDSTRWIMVILLLLVIGAAVFVLLRSPGRDRAVQDGRTDGTTPAGLADRDGDGVADVDEGRTATATTTGQPLADERPVQTVPTTQTTAASQTAATTGTPARETELFDQEQTGADRTRPADTQPVTGTDAAPAAGTGTTGLGYPEQGQDDDISSAAQIGAMGAAGAAGAAAPLSTTSADRDGYLDETARPMETSPRQSVPEQPTGTSAAPASGRPTVSHDEDGLTAAQIGAMGAAGATTAGATAAGSYRADENRDEAYSEARGPVAEPERSWTDGQRSDFAEPQARTDLGPDAGYRTGEGATSGSTAFRDEPLTADEVLDGTTEQQQGSLAGAGATFRDDTLRDDTYRDDAPYRTGDDLDRVSPAQTDRPDLAQQDLARDDLIHERTDRLDDGGMDRPAAGGMDAPAGTGIVESAYGPGSAEPQEDGSGPQGWTVKGNAGSMLFHTPDSPSYDNARAEVWFESEEAARAAGFAHWDRRRR